MLLLITRVGYGRAWQFPSFDNADTFVQRLVREGVLVHDAMVDDLHRGRRSELTPRSVRRRFFRATGLTPGLIRQIEK